MEKLDVDYTRHTKKTLSDLIGNFKESIGKVSLTDKNVYTQLEDCDLKEWSTRIVELHKCKEQDNLTIYNVYLSYPNSRFSNGTNIVMSEFGYLLSKDGVPHILSNINGDDMGVKITRKNDFVVSGHDGSYTFDIDNPENFDDN